MVFIEALRYYQNWAKETDSFALFERFFCLPSNTPYESLARFCKMKYIFVVNFISIAFVVKKFKIFKFCYTTTSESMKGRLLWGGGDGEVGVVGAHSPPNIVQSC